MSSPRTPRPLVIEPFDPEPSLVAALELCTRAGVRFALAGRLAVWTWVVEGEQEFTKDVDVAVAEADAERLRAMLVADGYTVHALSIGGVAIRQGPIRVDFIDRRVELGDLFTAAVAAAQEEGTRAALADGRTLPVVPARFVAAMKLATGDPRDERDVERILRSGAAYAEVRQTVRAFLGPASANRLDHLGARIGLEPAARSVRASSDGG